ncbi:DUF1836 domain-containing protein [Salirhabdus sp. Marseille-P4669]|uniref:DUF1836 domain-containing protein n=1 Tax=Salirhabdus sp. Marseille-P4669 TaxID=2042310 RepID=UPI000C7D16DD|nr:DUF1836 domain-containing protein [Salirhabdus sp. Marseille-P4669]
MHNLNEIIDDLKLDRHLKIEDVPNIDLYMDQVIQLFEETYKDTKRNDEEKILTKTMINNYAKGKLFFPIKNKKYSKEHLLLISLIYQLKGALSISDIKTVLSGLNDKITEEDFELDAFYNRYLGLVENNVKDFYAHVNKKEQEVKEEVDKLSVPNPKELEQILLIASLVNLSNYYRKTAERLVDQLQEQKEEV